MAISGYWGNTVRIGDYMVGDNYEGEKVNKITLSIPPETLEMSLEEAEILAYALLDKVKYIKLAEKK